MFTKLLCVYCDQPITFFDRLFGNVYQANEKSVAHKKCRVEPKAGA